LGLVEPFYFRNATLTWHRAVFINIEHKTVIAACGRMADFSRRNKKYEDVEDRPYAGKVCSRCDNNSNVRVKQNARKIAKKEPPVPDVQLQIRERKSFPTPVETYGIDADMEQSPLGPGLSYDDAVRRKPRRILP
jgi:hypothetical protein